VNEKFDFLRQELDLLASSGLYRKPYCIDRRHGARIWIDGAEKVLFCSNNYLGLADHPALSAAASTAAAELGFGSAASRLVSGTMRIHEEVEERFARLLKKESALLFSSGWCANEGLIKALAGKGDLVVLDKYDHASIIDAVQATGADFKTYRRKSATEDTENAEVKKTTKQKKNTESTEKKRTEKITTDSTDYADFKNHARLERLLDRPGYRRRFIITESIFSMDGDRADLTQLVEIRDRYDAILIVDEAHSLGCVGEHGAGMCEQDGVLEKVDIIVATMSKAMGACGGIVAGPAVLREYLINKCRGFIYTTAPSVANSAAVLAGLDIVETEPQRRTALARNAEYLRGKLKQLGLNTGSSTSHIIPVIIGSEEEAVKASKYLFDAGYFVAAIRPPTVPPGTSRLRISVQSDHTAEEINGLCSRFADLIRAGLLQVSH
jgi:7-keto-8-aminopelargonate synthetase-like enzyme